VAAAKTYFKKQALVAGTKQIKKADKAGRLTKQLDLPALFCAATSPCFVEVHVLQTNMC
jgi:hypothetical protein